MEDDPQPRIAILGAGPIGLEAALYARYLGYPVELIERSDRPAKQLVLNDSPLPFKQLASPLGVAALRAQNSEWMPPRGDEQLTPAQWWESYLAPLAESDLISDVLKLGTEVLAFRRNEEDTAFLIECRDASGGELVVEAEIVIDCTGRVGNRQWFAEEAPDPEFGFLNPDADVYVLGGKSCPESSISFAQGLVQIRELFAILGEREDLDLYATMPAIKRVP
jgi:NADPH-dependent 2,4-dienoyl-CoA reductase/sulfur reductase-like enzyme